MLPKNNTWALLFGVALGVGGMLSLIASSSPDGLEKVAEVHGFLDRGIVLFSAPLTDYSFSFVGMRNGVLLISLARILGTGIVFLGLLFLGRVLFFPAFILRRRQK
ncbi:MAG: PDGLE domain-containing protein [Candidatus Moraniibacteriota bacterium]|nr:MAG: PDGLE domain-containing protein [Candidatus Moranbacteria bacterium]